MKTPEIRTKFLRFFKDKGHTVVKSDSLIPRGDPTLLFSGAGMNQFKDYFLGARKDLKRATSSQKCIRTGDLDVVGKTPYHHSFFEMLGNFSFGDYFKEDAIQWAWEFLTATLKLPKDQLLVSVHKSDDEAFKIWTEKIGISKNFVARLDDHSNFWPADAPQLGPNGPCGPCSEIFYDQGQNYPGSTKGFWAEDESGRYAEIWNLVFTQFNRQGKNKLAPLKANNIDTGMGLERLACVLQGKHSNFETDLFTPLLAHLKKGGSKLDTASLNAISDHARAAIVAISDGVHPSNEKRGYVIRKLIRRAVWKGHLQNLKAPLLTPLVDLVVNSLRDAYPELAQNRQSIRESIGAEEDRFRETIEKGHKQVTKLIQEAKKRKKKSLNGAEVFELYDTFGFPDELSRSIAADSGIQIDEKGFTKLLEEQKKRAKESSKIQDTIFTSSDVNQELVNIKTTKFLGYDTLSARAEIVWLSLSGKKGAVALDQSPFYPEGGGQVGDRGVLKGSGFEFEVTDTQKKEKVIVHSGTLTKGTPQVKHSCEAVVNQTLRDGIKRNHTATHILQSALRAVLGKHVRQVGSLVNEGKLRFDYTHGKALTADQIKEVEDWVNQVVLQSIPVQPKQEPYDNAIKSGALAFFGDKYTDRVRTITISDKSKELCGGTHCHNTGEIGSFIIISETSIGSGTRRIQALTGQNTIQYTKSLLQTVREQAKQIGKMNQQLKQQNQTSGGSAKGPKVEFEKILKRAQTIGSVRFVSESFSDYELPQLRTLADQIRSKSERSVLALFSKSNSRVNLVLALTKDLASSPLDAKVLAQKIAPLVDGSAGGRKDLAQGGGKSAKGIANAVKTLSQLISEVQQ